MKKVLIITYYWPPSGGAGVQRWLKFARYLPSFGVEPYVLTVDSKFASWPQRDKSLLDNIPEDLRVFTTRSFEPLNLLARLLGTNKVPYGGFSNVNKSSPLQTILRFIRGNFFIPDARAGWNRYALRKAEELIQLNNIPTVITTGPPHSTHLIGLKLKRRFGIKWIADFRDPWTDIYYYSDLLHTPLARRIDRRKERLVLESADRVIANCNSNRELLRSKVSGVDTEKFSVITNGYDEEDFPPVIGHHSDDRRGNTDQGFIITYSGTMSEHYQPGVFFRALKSITLNNPGVSFRLRIAGNISVSAERQLRENGLGNILEYPGYVNHATLAGFLVNSSALLYLFPVTEHDLGVAGKLFEYLAAKKPVIAIGNPESDAATIIRECDAGKIFTREDEGGITEYLQYLVETFIQKGVTISGNDNHSSYTRRQLASRLASMI